MMITVDKIDTMLRINVSSKYFAINGIVSDVGGRIFETSSKKTTKASKMEMPKGLFNSNTEYS
jgi:hypothetical protein